MRKKKMRPVFVNFIMVMVVIGILFLFSIFINTMIRLELLGMGFGLYTGGEGIELSKFILILLYIFFVLIPSSYAMFLMFFSCMALYVYAPGGRKLLAYRILMGIVYMGIALLAFGVFMLFGDSLFLNVISFVIEVGLMFVLIINLWNTYTDRIKITN